MKNRRWIRALAFLLVCALTVFSPVIAGAAHVAGDINGDGKITAFDAQLLLENAAGLRDLGELGSLSAASIVRYILGDQAVDAGDLNGDGVMEIYTAEGLQELYNLKNGQFILMNDIDLAGAVWTPIIGFAGTLNGNGKTISNINITEGVASCKSPGGTKMNMGFLGDTTGTAVIQDLHLRNVTITAADEALYMGLLVASDRGQISGCTVTGTIIDNRQTHETKTYIGVLAGRICNPDSGVAAGNIAGGTSLTVADEYGVYKTTGLCADAKLLIASKDNVVTGKLVGWAPSTSTVSGIWSDSSGSSQLLPQAIRDRRETVVAHMNAMGTVAWTPSEELHYYSSNNCDQDYYVGQVYYGLPYNHKNGSMGRFLSQMASQDPETGVYTTVTGLTDGYSTTNEAGQEGYVGFVQTMGNDCSSSVGWAWMQVSPARVNVTTESYAGGVYVNRTRHMVPNETNRAEYGIYPIGSWVTSNYDASTGTLTAVEYDPTLAAYQVTTERSTDDIVLNNGVDVMLEAYAQTHKGDAMVRHRATEQADGSLSHFGHTRLVSADPVVIRDVNGAIDPKKSYFLMTEQGAGVSNADGDNSTWRVNYRRTFDSVITFDPDAEPTTKAPYVPVTMRALQDTVVKAPYVTQYSDNKLSGPASGKVYCNYRIDSIIVKVTDAAGKVYYDREAFTGIDIRDGISRGINTSADLSTLHSDAFYAAAAETGMVSGNLYYYSVILKTSNGVEINLTEKFLGTKTSLFTYTAPAE